MRDSRFLVAGHRRVKVRVLFPVECANRTFIAEFSVEFMRGSARLRYLAGLV